MEQDLGVNTFKNGWIFREKQHYPIFSPEITSVSERSELAFLLRNTDDIDLISKYEKAQPYPETIILNRGGA